MDPIKDFEQEISQVLRTCEISVAQYPAGLDRLAGDYLEKQDMRSNEKRRNSICYLLPFWFKNKYGIDADTCMRLAEANAFGLLYFFTQDEVMDAPAGEYKGNLLPLSSLFNLELLSRYRSLFSSVSSFWKYYDKYFGEWAQSVAWERREHFGCCTGFSEEDLVMLARKAAPLKIPCAAICLLSGKESDIPAWERLIDCYHTVIQLVDDWRDWKEDLKTGNCSYFLSKAAEANELADFGAIKEAVVHKTILTTEIPEELFAKAIAYCNMAVEICNKLELPYLYSFLRLQEEYCSTQIAKIREEKKAICQGGLNYLFYKLNASR